MATGFSWPTPTTHTDGTPIAAGELAGYQIGIGTAAGNYTVFLDLPATATSVAFSAFVSFLAPGTYHAAIKAIGATQASNSAWSNDVTFTVSVVTPPAAAVIATVALTAA